MYVAFTTAVNASIQTAGSEKMKANHQDPAHPLLPSRDIVSQNGDFAAALRTEFAPRRHRDWIDQ